MTGKLSEIKKVIQYKKPDIVCFCETWLGQKVPRFQRYNAEWNSRLAGGRGGGTGIIVQQNVYHRTENIIPYAGGVLEFQVIKIRNKNQHEMAIFNFYNPNKNVTKDELKYYIDKLGDTFVMIGDLNAHTPVLDNKYHKYRNMSGRSLEEVLVTENVILANPQNLITFIDRRSGKPSCLDVCLVSPNLAPNVTISRFLDVGSDHSPILCEIHFEILRSELSHPPKYKTDAVNWELWKRNIPESDLTLPVSVDELNEDITRRLIVSSDETMKKTTGKGRMKHYTPWWNVECSRRVAIRRRAKRIFEKYPNLVNLIDFKKKTAEAKRAIIASKKRVLAEVCFLSYN